MSIDGNGKPFQIGGFEVDVIVHGSPGKSVCHGSLGFSTVALNRRGDPAVGSSRWRQR